MESFILISALLVFCFAVAGCGTAKVSKKTLGEPPAREESGQLARHWSALHLAVSSGDLTKIKELLSRGGNANTIEPQSKVTPLHLAAEGGDADLVNLLLEHGADVNIQEVSVLATPLHIAVQNCHIEVVQRLLAQPEIDPLLELSTGLAPLHMAVLFADTSGEEAHKQQELREISLAIIKALLESQKIKINYEYGHFSPLHLAAERGDDEVIGILLDAGANVNATGRLGLTPLHRAAQMNYVETTRLLLKNKADVNARHDHGATPLLVAAIAANTDIVELLLEFGADITLANEEGVTPLHAAAFNGDFDLVKILLGQQPKPDINAKKRGGYTPLHLAAAEGYVITAGILIDHGADTNALTDIAHTPCDLARQHNHEEVFELLMRKSTR